MSGHHHHHDDDTAAGYRVTLIGAVGNIFLSIVKLIAGVVGNSAALVADAVHSVSDLATDVVVYFSLKISSQKPDEEHPYGHGRAETIGSAIIGAAIMAVGLGIAWEVFSKVIEGSAFAPNQAALWGVAASILVKEALYHYTKLVGERLRSESIIANAWHHRSDAVSSVAALIGIGGAMMGYPLLDPLAAVAVGLMISAVGWKIFWDALQNLMDKGVSAEELARMEKIITGEQDVLDHHELKTRKVGSDTFVDLHIQVAPRISISEAHNIAETVRRKLREQIDHVTDALIHIDAENDLQGRHYGINRAAVEKVVDAAIAEFDDLELEDQVTLHFFLHHVAADVTVKFRHGVSSEREREVAEQLSQKLLADGIITEVNVLTSLASHNADEKAEVKVIEATSDGDVEKEPGAH